jgi:energy-coupling factor transport system ATP-binding protein
LIEIENLSYAYPQQTEPSLRNISLRFNAGELALVAGHSGSGKTTLTRCINGLIPRRYGGGRLQGRVLMAGADAAKLGLAELAVRVGTVLQDPETQIVAAEAFYDIAFGLENLGLPRDDIRARVQRTADQIGIAHLLGRSTASLSGGEKQKVALAGVLAMQPDVLLFDEPLAALDPASAREVMGLLRDLADAGKAVIIVEHRIKAVQQQRLDQTVVVEHGEIVPDAEEMARLSQHYPSIHKRARQPNSPTLAELRNVSFAHPNGKPVLSNVALRVQPGDVIALLGRNGVGKSTLCKHLIGLLRPGSGQVFVDGRDVVADNLSVAQLARSVGYVFQSPSFMLFAPSVREELAFGPRNLSVPNEQIAASGLSAAQSLNVREFMERHPLALSFGQQKRVSIASVLAMQPKLLIMDEPSAGQDHDNIVRFMNDLMAYEPVQAMIFATHDLDLARAYANRVVVMEDGAIAADGEPEVVLADEGLLRRCRLK